MSTISFRGLAQTPAFIRRLAADMRFLFQPRLPAKLDQAELPDHLRHNPVALAVLRDFERELRLGRLRQEIARQEIRESLWPRLFILSLVGAPVTMLATFSAFLVWLMYGHAALRAFLHF